jgi:hypothetical protein
MAPSGSEPGDADNAFKSVHAGTNGELVAVNGPMAGTYDIKWVGVTAFPGVTMQGVFFKFPR